MKLVNFLVIITLSQLSLINIAQADWSVDFHPPTQQRPSLVIDLPDNLDLEILMTLAVELDGIEITSVLSFEGGDFLYTPIEPLNNGDHFIRLVIVNPDGSVVDKAQWTFKTSQLYSSNNNNNNDSLSEQEKIKNTEAWLRSASFNADTLTEFSHRIRQKHTPFAPDRSIISGSGNVQGNIQAGKWTVNANTNYLLQSDTNLALTGNLIDIGEYNLTVDYSGDLFNAGATLGHHDIGIESLLFSSFNRRGTSVYLEDKNSRVSANAFALRPQALAGTREFTGVADSDNRVEGVSATIKPFSNDSDALKVTGLYYEGEGSTGGIGIEGEDQFATGSGWGLIVEKSFLEGKIDFRGEYAHALYDADASESALPEDKSDAFSFLIETRPFDNLLVFEKQLDLTLGAKYERVDTFFQSFANQGIAADRDVVTAYSSLYWGGLSADLQLANETNNVDDLSSSPTDRLQSIIWNTNYSFELQPKVTNWTGSPYLSFSGFVSTLDRQKTPTGYAGFDTDSISTSFTFGGGSSYEHWYWSASHTYSEFNDRTKSTSDTVSNLSNLGLGLTISDRLDINTSLQHSSFEDKTNNTTSYSTNVLFGLRSILIADTLDLNLNYNLNLAGGDIDSPDIHIINSELEWTLVQARQNRPGLAFAVRGSMEMTNGNTTPPEDETQYQVFTVLRISAPLSTEY